MSKDKSIIISEIAAKLLEDNEDAARTIISQEYPHKYFELEKRTYTMAQKMLIQRVLKFSYTKINL